MNTCYYCGLPANTVDHVVPQVLLEAAKRMLDTESYLALQSRGRRLTVPSCQQCNSILGGKYDPTLKDRKARLKIRLRKKLQKDLGLPHWTDGEIAQLGPNLQQVVLEGMVRQWIAQQRLQW